MNNNKKYLADTFIVAIRKNGCIYACIVENFIDIVPLVVNKWGYINNSIATFEIIEEYAREVVLIDTVADFERKAKNWNRRHNMARYRGYYFEVAVCRRLHAKINPIRNTDHMSGYDAVLANGEGVEIKYIKGIY